MVNKILEEYVKDGEYFVVECKGGGEVSQGKIYSKLWSMLRKNMWEKVKCMYIVYEYATDG